MSANADTQGFRSGPTVVRMGDNARTRSPWSEAAARTIRAERAAADLSQAAVIKAAGLSRSTYLRLESGERVADISQLAAIALALGIDPTDFVQRISARVAEVHADFVADPLPAGAFSKGDLDLAADVDPDAKADED